MAGTEADHTERPACLSLLDMCWDERCADTLSLLIFKDFLVFVCTGMYAWRPEGAADTWDQAFQAVWTCSVGVGHGTWVLCKSSSEHLRAEPAVPCVGKGVPRLFWGYWGGLRLSTVILP